MSFSSEVKEEISKYNNLGNKDELKFEYYGYFVSDNMILENGQAKYSTENEYNIDRFAKVIRNIGFEDFNIDVNGKIFYIEYKIKENIDEKIEEILKCNDKESRSLFQAFIRGLFMGAGSINNPQKKYHLECKIRKEGWINSIIDKMSKSDINLKQRENTIYIKEGEEISKFLAFVGAAKSVMRFEEIRVERYMNNKVNRLVNCESANLNKVLNASIEQINAIKKLKEEGKFEKLDDSLKEIANLRIENPDMPLVELGKKLSVPIGKSGVNYRLKKIIKIAEE